MIYFDNAATTRPNQGAVARALTYLQEEYYNPSALYKEGFALKNELKEAREYLVSRIADPSEVQLIFTACGTEADNQALFSFARRGNLVITAGEHSAIFATANELKNRGIELRIAPLNADGSVNEAALLELVDNKTSMVSAIHVNNETGAINDVNTLAKRVKEKNPRVIFHSDGVQAYGKVPYTMGAFVDLYSVSAHKIGGLKGVGGLFVRKKAYAALQPYIYGGGQESGKRSGTENVFGIKQFQFAAEEKFKALADDYKRIESYREKLWEQLDKAAFTRLSPENGTPYILTLAVREVKGEVLLHILNDKGLLVGNGSACSSNAKN
ncbi:MAG: aminotransferase class V-fold PLP-dependent enzyme, partial [Clostridia bacterium]|nr:aminotransferase class V-fold PLP-dependent enzyme [Clostridia bacterium]